MPKPADIEATKDCTIATGLDRKQANQLRSLLQRQIPRVWILVKNTCSAWLLGKDDFDHPTAKFDVSIANDWGGRPSDRQHELAKTIVDGFQMNNNDEPITVRDEDIIEVTDDQLVS